MPFSPALRVDADAHTDPARRRLLAAAATSALILPAAALANPSTAFASTTSSSTSASGKPDTRPTSAPPNDGRRDFDFYLGRWRVHNRRLKQRFVGSDDWEEYEATDESKPILSGLGSIDDYRTEHFGGDFRGMAIRFFNPQTRLWSAYWSTNRSGTLDPPVVGGFKDGIGTFFGYDQDGDRAVYVRCLWSEIAAAHVKWEQAFSIDQGKTWETNLVMDMTRLA